MAVIEKPIEIASQTIAETLIAKTFNCHDFQVVRKKYLHR